MRFLSGFILGVLITIGAAYVHDAMTAPTLTGPDSSGVRMVNWDVVRRSFTALADSVRDDFDRLVGRPSHSPPTKGI